MQCGLLQHVKRFLASGTYDLSIKIATCELLEVLAYERGQIQPLIDSELGM